MSIVAMVGLPRSGKSYNTVMHQILPALRAGRRVATNIPLYEDVIREDIKTGELVQFQVQELQQQPERIFDVCTPGTVFVLDEVWRLFPAGVKADRVPEPFRKLLAEHGHMVDDQNNACQVVLVTQDLAQIAAFARQLVEQTIVHKKMGLVLSSKQFRVKIFDGAHTGQNPPDSRCIRTAFGTYKKDVWKYYKSHTLSEAEKDGANEKGIDNRGSIWRRPMVWVAFGACVVFLLWGVPKARSLLHNPTGKELVTKPVQERARTGVERPRGESVRPPAQAVARVELVPWRISAVVIIDIPGRSRAVVTDGRVSVTIPFDDYCDTVGEYWHVCHWQGQEVTEWSAPPANRQAASQL